MKELKILFITKNLSHFIERSSVYFYEELRKQANVIVWHEHGYIQDILSKLPFQPDFILLNDYCPQYCPFIRGLKGLSIPVGTILHDLHYRKERRKSWLKNEEIKYIFSIYREPFMKWYSEFRDRFIWLPHHINTDIFMDYQQVKTVNWLMMGAVYEHLYPLRSLIMKQMYNKPGFICYGHPGYRDHVGKNVLVGKEYAMEINKAKIFLTCDSIYQYPVLKYFEVLGCNTLLLAPGSKELNDLGFVNGETFVAIDETNFTEKADYYLHHESERIAIAKNGYEMVRKRHSTSQRVQEFLQKVAEIIQ
ncbi:MAG: glycosyltransferase [Bacillaceae bacterium]|nr:glycosyltransferase [Bacillaceae bacterium]